VLEFSEPRCTPVRWLNNLYTRHIMPTTATLISGDKSGAYRYLPMSVATFTKEAQFVRELTDVGLVETRVWRLTLGVCNCYRALKPQR